MTKLPKGDVVNVVIFLNVGVLIVSSEQVKLCTSNLETDWTR